MRARSAAGPIGVSVLAVLALGVTVACSNSSGPNERTESEFVEDVRSGQVIRIIVEGSRVEYEVTDGTIYRANIVSREPLRQIFANAGIDLEQVPPIEIVTPTQR